MQTTYQLTESRDDSHMVIGQPEMDWQQLLEALENFRITCPNVPVAINTSDGRMLVDEGRANEWNKYDELEPLSESRAVLYVRLGTCTMYVIAICDDHINWSDDIDAAQVFETTRGIQSARDRVTCRNGNYMPEVKFI